MKKICILCFTIIILLFPTLQSNAQTIHEAANKGDLTKIKTILKNQPEYLGDEVNGAHPFIAPGGSYIIFQKRYRLHISFRGKDGSWSKAEQIKTGIDLKRELCPVVSPDGKFLFFTGHKDGLAFVYWVDAGILDDYKPDEDK